jgi:hypothetical protein
MKFAKAVFWVAGIWGGLVLTPLYFLYDVIGKQDPPPITHPGVLLWVCGSGIGVANCVSDYCAASRAVPDADHSLDLGEIFVVGCGGDFSNAETDACKRLGICGDGWIVGSVVCGGVGGDGTRSKDEKGNEDGGVKLRRHTQGRVGK